jgi:hypothetical protein
LLDIPIPGDYDGVGHAEMAVYRASTAQWFVAEPNGGRILATYGWSGLNDLPAPGTSGMLAWYAGNHRLTLGNLTVTAASTPAALTVAAPAVASVASQSISPASSTSGGASAAKSASVRVPAGPLRLVWAARPSLRPAQTADED